MRNLIVGLLAVIGFTSIVSAAEITVYDEKNFRGNSVTFTHDMPDLRQIGWNERIRSFRVESGNWEVCDKRGYRNCQTFKSGDRVRDVRSIGLYEDISAINRLKKGEMVMKDIFEPQHQGYDDRDHRRAERDYYNDRNRDYYSPRGDSRIVWNNSLNARCSRDLNRAFVERFGDAPRLVVPLSNDSGEAKHRGRVYRFQCDYRGIKIW